MKRFKFSLEAVREYRELILDEKKKELADAIQAVIRKEKEINVLARERAGEVADFNTKKSEGMTAVDAQNCERHIRVLQNNIDTRRQELKRLNEIEEQKKDDVVLARQEVMALDKLKEKRIADYNLAALKEEETLIEEIVSNQRSNILASESKGAQ